MRQLQSTIYCFKSIQQWKKQFLENAPLVFEEAVPVKKYKEELREKEKQIEDLQKALGKATIECKIRSKWTPIPF